MSVCHELWIADGITHVCGKQSCHVHWHVCPCGAVVMTNSERRGTTAPEPIDNTAEIAAERALDLSTHAAMRRIEMGVSHRAIYDTLIEPALSYPADQRRVPGGVMFQRDDLVVVTNSDGLVVTLLWHGAEGRDDDGQPKRRDR